MENSSKLLFFSSGGNRARTKSLGSLIFPLKLKALEENEHGSFERRCPEYKPLKFRQATGQPPS